jgi:hypothetical protein
MTPTTGMDHLVRLNLALVDGFYLLLADYPHISRQRRRRVDRKASSELRAVLHRVHAPHDTAPDAERESPDLTDRDPAKREALDAFLVSLDSFDWDEEREQQYRRYRSDVDPELERMGIDKALHDGVAEVALDLPLVQTPEGLQPDLRGAVRIIKEGAGLWRAL